MNKKIVYAFPPMKNPKGYATIGQNRQFQWFKDPTFVYPIIPAISATMMAKSQNSILWLDAIAEELNEVEFGNIVIQGNPDYMVFECPTPLINRYVEIINGIKAHLPNIKIILCGEHITAMDVPECKADHFVKGGKWHFDVFKIINGVDYDITQGLPHIDRNITRWWLYAYRNGNYRCLPATYIMSSQDCWYGKCTFCSWATYHDTYDLRQADDVLKEIENLIAMGFKEIFDDSGTFPTGDWLKYFCNEMIERGYNRYISIGCNMRFGCLTAEDMALMKKAGFRMILWGLESYNQSTLDRIDKGIILEQIDNDLVMAKKAGLDSHLTCMFGHYWESREEADNTFTFVKKCLLNGNAFSAQATLCIPYPITPLWKECKEKKLLVTENWDDYDMSAPIVACPIPAPELMAYQKKVYNLAFHPLHLWQKLKRIRGLDDFRYYFRIAKKIYDRFGNFYEVGKVS